MTDVTALKSQLFATVPEAAGVLRMDPRSVRRGIERGEIPAVRIGDVIRIPTAALLGLAELDASAPDGASAGPATGPAPTSTSPASTGRSHSDDGPQQPPAANIVTGI